MCACGRSGPDRSGARIYTVTVQCTDGSGNAATGVTARSPSARALAKSAGEGEEVGGRDGPRRGTGRPARAPVALVPALARRRCHCRLRRRRRRGGRRRHGCRRRRLPAPRLRCLLSAIVSPSAICESAKIACRRTSGLSSLSAAVSAATALSSPIWLSANAACCRTSSLSSFASSGRMAGTALCCRPAARAQTAPAPARPRWCPSTHQ